MLPQRLDPRPYLANQPDPRRETRNKLHPLRDILMMVLCAVLSGMEDRVGMEIGIGRSLTAPPSHTTGHTDHVSGGSTD